MGMGGMGLGGMGMPGMGMGGMGAMGGKGGAMGMQRPGMMPGMMPGMQGGMMRPMMMGGKGMGGPMGGKGGPMGGKGMQAPMQQRPMGMPGQQMGARPGMMQQQPMGARPGGDMTASNLANAPPGMQKQMLGEKIFPLIARMQPEMAGKITGMMLEMDNSELLILLESPEQLKMKVLELLSKSNPEAACAFAKQLLEPVPGVGPLMDINLVVEVFMSQNRLQEATSILLEALKGNEPGHAALQTKLLEMNLLQAPQVAEAIFQMNLFSHYDRRYIAGLCEKAGLAQRALEHYNDARDVKRVMMSGGANMTPEFLVQYFSNMSPDVCLE